MRKLLILLLFILEINAQAQQDLSIGVGFGPYIRNNTGTNIVSDSITIIADGSRSMINVYSIFLEYQLNKNIQFRSSINGTDHLIGFLMYNSQATCQFCDVVKGTVVGSFNLNSVSTVAIKIPFRMPLDLLVFGGIRTNFNFTRDEPDISFRNGTRHQGLAEAYNNMDKTVKPVYFNSVIGMKSDWRRLSLVFELDKNIGQSITNELEMFGQQYTFLNRTNTFTITLNYKIIPWKNKNSQQTLK
jgi:hypothetical protein